MPTSMPVAQVLEALPQLVLCLEEHGRVVFSSDSWLALTGRTAEDFDSIVEAVHPEDRAAVLPWRAARARVDSRVEVRIRQASGDHLWHEVRPHPIRARANEPSGRWLLSFVDVEERRRERLANQAERERVATFLSAAPGAFFVMHWDADQNPSMIYESPKFKEIYGTGPDEERWKRIDPDYIALTRESLARTAETGDDWEMRYPIQHPEHGRIWLEARATPERHADGTVTWSGFALDVTERQRTEESLRASRAQLRTAMDAGRMTPFSHDLTTDVLRWDPNAAQVLDLPEDRLPQTISVENGYPAKLRERAGETAPSRAEAESPLTIEQEISLGDGRIAWVAMVGRMTRTGPQETFSGVAWNITDRKLAEQELEASRARLHAALDAGGMCLFSRDYRSGTLTWAPNAGEILGLPSAQLPTTMHEYMTLLSEEERADEQMTSAYPPPAGTPVETERRLRLANGAVHWLAFYGRVTPDDTGTAGRFDGVVVNITNRKRVEDARLRSQKLEALGTLAGGIAHDFNNILFAVSGNVSMALTELSADHEAVDYLREVQRGTARASALVRRILAFSRPSAGDEEAVAPRQVVNEAVELLRATLPRMVELRLLKGARVSNVAVSGTEIHQVVVNLVTNAVQAIGSERGRVTLSLEQVHVSPDQAELHRGLRPGHYVRMSVRDDGPGMEPAVLARIFDPYFSTKRDEQGTGLGLSVVHGILQSRGGSISAYSAVGKGTRFHVYLPLAASEEAPGDSQPPAMPLALARRIVYVDDEPSIIRIAQRVLERLGYRVDAYSRALDALDSVRESPPDVLVTDLSMLEMSGLDLIREVRKHYPDLPVILTTGHLPSSLEVELAAMGVEHVVLKADMVEQLGEALKSVLKEDAPEGRPF